MKVLPFSINFQLQVLLLQTIKFHSNPLKKNKSCRLRWKQVLLLFQNLQLQIINTQPNPCKCSGHEYLARKFKVVRSYQNFVILDVCQHLFHLDEVAMIY